MGVEFDDVFSGVGAWGAEGQGQDFIDDDGGWG
jgi:hypothetical protein